jgi:hypothetical protein
VLQKEKDLSPLEGSDFLGQPGDAAAEVQDLAVPFLTARTRGTTGKHGNLLSTVSEKPVGQRGAFLRGGSPSEGGGRGME